MSALRGGILLLVVSIVLSRGAPAAVIPNGTLDPTFVPPAISNGDVLAVVEQPDGKLLLGGQFSKLNGATHLNIGRLNADGTVDSTFTTATDVGVQVTSIVLQPDGKIIILGSFGTVNGTNRLGLARLNADGTLDTSFDPGRVLSLDGLDDGAGGASNPGFASAVIVQTTGRVVLFGDFAFVITGVGTNVARSGVAAFSSAGAFDATFNPGAGFALTAPQLNNVIYAVRQTTTGNLVAAGTFSSFDGHAVSGFVRLTASGAYDATFNAGTGATTADSVGGLFRQADDKIVVFGNFTTFNGASRNGLARMLINGALDTGFVPGAFLDYVDARGPAAIGQQSSGKLIAIGAFHSYAGNAANGIVRLNLADGSYDSSFVSSNAAGPNGYTESVAVRSDDKIFLGGYFSSYDGSNCNNIAKLTANGAFDPTFTPLGAQGSTQQIVATGLQSDGKIIVGGIFSSIGGVPKYNLVRLLPDGSLDNTFATGSGASRSVRALKVLPNDKILIAGQFGAINGVQRVRVALLNSDGTIDPSLNPGTGPNDIVYGMTTDSAGNIYLGGIFTAVNGIARAKLVKLSPAGVVDPTFNPGTGTDTDIRALAPPTATTGLVLGGAFNIYNGSTAHRIARVDAATGALDTAFVAATGTGFSSVVRAITLLSNGKYLAAGSFLSFNGVARSRVARLNSNGSLDTSFVPPAFSLTASSLLPLGSRIYIGGSFLAPVPQMTRVLSTGALDSSFSSGTGATITPADALSASFGQVSAMAQQPDGKLIVGGVFTQYNGVARASLARVTGPQFSLTITHLPNLHFQLTGTGEPSTSYLINGASAMSSPFTFVTEVTTNPSGTFQYEDSTHAALPAYFYDLVAE